jgi:hypothetical protein
MHKIMYFITFFKQIQKKKSFIRNNFVVRNGKLWYEMVMVRNDLLRYRPGLQLLSESKMLP